MPGNKTISTSVDIQVPFYDIDMLGIAWHGHYAKYFEIARCSLLDKIDYGYMSMRQSGYLWPVIDLQVRYIASLKFEQTMRVHAELVEYEFRLKIKYSINDSATGQRIAKGETTQVAVDSETGKMCFASPQIMLDKVEAIFSEFGE